MKIKIEAYNGHYYIIITLKTSRNEMDFPGLFFLLKMQKYTPSLKAYFWHVELSLKIISMVVDCPGSLEMKYQ